MRDLWQLDDSIHFLNHGSFGATPRAVLKVQSELRARLEADPVHFMKRTLEPALDDAASALAAFVGAQPADVVFVNNATTGVNAVLRSLRFEPGDELLTTDHAYNACANVLRYVAEQWGARVVVAPVPFPVESAQAISAAIHAHVSTRTKLVLLDQITSPTALVFPVDALVKDLEGRGIAVLVDAAHAPGHVPLHLDATGASFTTGNLHKWVCTPKGAAFLHVRRDWQDRVRPTVISHGANSKRTDRSRFQLEFGWVGTDDPTPYLCVPAALKTLASMCPGGIPELMQRNHDDAVAMRARLLEVFPQPVAPPELLGAMASIVVPDAPADLHDRLFQEFNLEVPGFWFGGRALLRVSAHRHVRPGDLDALLTALRKTVPGARGALA